MSAPYGLIIQFWSSQKKTVKHTSKPRLPHTYIIKVTGNVAATTGYCTEEIKLAKLVIKGIKRCLH